MNHFMTKSFTEAFKQRSSSCHQNRSEQLSSSVDVTLRHTIDNQLGNASELTIDRLREQLRSEEYFGHLEAFGTDVDRMTIGQFIGDSG